MNKLELYFSDYIKKKLSPEKVHRARSCYHRFKAFPHRKNLKVIGKIFKTDKTNSWMAQDEGHNYVSAYEEHFKSLRNKKLKILEIGIGGEDNPYIGGNSLRMWKCYFSRSLIYGVDLYDKRLMEEKRIRTFKGAQNDQVFLADLVRQVGPFDIIIDDGSHISSHVIETFKFLFNALNPKGFYVIEDLQTSYQDDYGGSSSDLNDPTTSMNFFKAACDSVNWKFTRNFPEESHSLLEYINSIHFYEKICFIRKK